MDQYLSAIWVFAFDFAPVGWAQCNGQILNIQTNAALFALLGTYFGGNGTSTFGLPDLRGRVPVGTGQGAGLSNYTQGQKGGAEGVTLTIANLAMHTHTSLSTPTLGAYTSSPGDQGNPVSPLPAFHGSGNSKLAPYSPTGGSTTGANSGQTTPTGGSQPVQLRNPYQALNYCIATTGAFPSRP